VIGGGGSSGGGGGGGGALLPCMVLVRLLGDEGAKLESFLLRFGLDTATTKASCLSVSSPTSSPTSSSTSMLSSGITGISSTAATSSTPTVVLFFSS